MNVEFLFTQRVSINGITLNSTVSCIYMIFVKVSEEATIAKYNPKDIQANISLQVVKNKH